jgi:hypothetical protein
MERETGIEPATNSLGSCDSTTELLPLFKDLAYARERLKYNAPPHIRRKAMGLQPGGGIVVLTP